MEVHPPEHPIFTWKQFFSHMAVIVLGLLIAIGLEQTVETKNSAVSCSASSPAAFMSNPGVAIA